jgi:aspartate/methionine/tyrosine aminotransferase
MLQIPFSGIKKIEEVANSSSDYISLSQGSIKVGGIPQQVKSYIQDMLNTDQTDYYQSCWGLHIVREKIAEKLAKRYNINLTYRRVLPTHGCIGGLSLIFLAMLEKDDEVIIPEPAYPAYSLLCKTSRSKPVYVSCKTAHGWQFDVEKIKAATTEKTKIIIFSNPVNPLGLIVPKETIIELINWCEAKGIYLIIDEAYRNYDFSGNLTSGLEFISKSNFVISANSFSKNFCMSGWRMGYLVVPENIIGALASMQDALLNCLNNTAQYAALYAMDHPELEQQFHETIKVNRTIAMQKLEPLVKQNIISYQEPQGAFFLFLKTDQKDSTNLCWSILNKAKVGLIPGITFGPSGSSYIRLCYAREQDVLQAGIDRLVKYFL